MDGEIIATRREMVNYDVHYLFLTHDEMNAHAVIDGECRDIEDGHSVNAYMFAKSGFLGKKAPKSFCLVEMRKEFEVVMGCTKFGLGDGVRLRIAPETSARSIQLLCMKCGRNTEEGNESISYCNLDDIRGLLRASFDEAVDRLGGQYDDAYLGKLVGMLNKTGDFINFDLVVTEASKNE